MKLLLLPFLVFTNTPTSVSDKQAVIDADAQLNQLIVQHKSTEAASYYAEEFMLITSSGKVKRKQDMLTEIALSDLQLEINETNDVTVRLLDNTAVLTGVLHQKGRYKSDSFDVRLTVTDTWVKTQNGWKLLSGHATVIK